MVEPSCSTFCKTLPIREKVGFAQPFSSTQGCFMESIHIASGWGSQLPKRGSWEFSCVAKRSIVCGPKASSTREKRSGCRDKRRQDQERKTAPNVDASRPTSCGLIIVCSVCELKPTIKPGIDNCVHETTVLRGKNVSHGPLIVVLAADEKMQLADCGKKC